MTLVEQLAKQLNSSPWIITGQGKKDNSFVKGKLDKEDKEKEDKEKESRLEQLRQTVSKLEEKIKSQGITLPKQPAQAVSGRYTIQNDTNNLPKQVPFDKNWKFLNEGAIDVSIKMQSDGYPQVAVDEYRRAVLSAKCELRKEGITEPKRTSLAFGI